MIERKRRLVIMIILSLLALSGASFGVLQNQNDSSGSNAGPPTLQQPKPLSSAHQSLERLAVKGRAPKTGYTRAQFSDGWQDLGNCDVRNYILARDLEQEELRSLTDCTVIKGILHDPYTGKIIQFERGATSSAKVQIDHVVALSDAWQKGAQQLSPDVRFMFANDPLNLLAVDGPANNNKSDSDAASWLPPNKPYRCRYVARQIAVKSKYELWVTQAEHDAMVRVLSSCPDQALPVTTTP